MNKQSKQPFFSRRLKIGWQSKHSHTKAIDDAMQKNQMSIFFGGGLGLSCLGKIFRASSPLDNS